MLLGAYWNRPSTLPRPGLEPPTAFWEAA